VIDSNIQIIFQDIDGCLNPADGEPFGVTPDWQPSANQVAMLQAINAALDASSVEHFAINTGRPWSLVRHLAQHLPSPKLRYFLLEHACVLYDRQQNITLDSEQLAATYGLDDLVERYQNITHIHVLFDWYQAQGRAQLEAHYKVPLPPIEKVANLSFAIPNGVDGDELLQRIQSLASTQVAKEHLAPLLFLRSDSHIDILPSIHKLDGIQLLCAHLQIDLKHALAVGDYLNDLSIFEAFDRVLCPSNAHPQIQALARSKGDYGEVSEQPYGLAVLGLLKELS
jgi:hydroxymethylpyrimidine pyrophosphatase-like HAD family hydrolase